MDNPLQAERRCSGLLNHLPLFNPVVGWTPTELMRLLAVFLPPATLRLQGVIHV